MNMRRPLSTHRRLPRPTAVAVAGLVLVAAATASAQDAAAAKPPADEPAAPAPKLPAPLPEFLDGQTIRKPNGMIVMFYRVNAVDPQLVQQELDRWKTPAGTIVPWGPSFRAGNDKKSVQLQNVLRIEDHEDNWPVLTKVLAMIDVPQPQVEVSAKILEITYDEDLRVGVGPGNIRVDRPVGDLFFRRMDFNFDNVLGSGDLSEIGFGSADKFVKFDYLLQLGKSGATAEIISEPSVVAVQGEVARINVGDKEPIVTQNLNGNNVSATTKFEDVGLLLEVQVFLIGRDLIRARVSPRLSRVADFRTVSTSNDRDVINPVISTREADTVIEVADRDTVVISGLQQTQEVLQRRGIPILMDIPLIGALFGSTSKRKVKTELVFFVTFTITHPGDERVIDPMIERERERERVRAATEAADDQ